jgi:hypothetical protein
VPEPTFAVGANAVRTDAGTQFVRDCGDVRNEATLDVRGQVAANGVLLATRVQVKR